MKNNKKEFDIDVANACIVREPLFPLKRLFAEPVTDNLFLSKSSRDLIGEFIEDLHFMEGIYWSSISLYSEIEKYKQGKLPAKKNEKIEASIFKYIIRSCTRCTPFGVFAGVYIAKMNASGKDEPGPIIIRRLIRHTRVDMGFLHHLLESTFSGHGSQKALSYNINNTVYKHGRHIRYIEPRVDHKGKITYEVSAMKVFPFLRKLLRLGRVGSVSYQQLSEMLSEEGVTEEEVDEVFRLLLQNKLLLPETVPQLTNQKDCERIKNIGTRANQLYNNNLLSQLDCLLQELDHNKVGQLPSDHLDQLNLHAETQTGYASSEAKFHNDMEVSYGESLQLPTDIQKAIVKAVSTRYSLFLQEDVEDPWRTFKRLFEERYGTGEIALMTLLDPDTGIGFPAKESIGANNSADHRIAGGVKTPSFLKKELDRLSFRTTSQPVIRLSDTSPENTAGAVPQEKIHFSVFASILPGGTIIIHSVGGSNPTALLGRFGYINAESRHLCEAIRAAEETSNPDCILAEIVHLPGATRLGNIAKRIPLSAYEIPILSPSSVDIAHQINLEDLMVSIRHDRITLRSRRLNKTVIPRLSNAHNYVKSDIPAYRFLCALAQQESLPSLGIHWDNSFSDYTYLPRVEANGILLSRAEWRIHKESRTEILVADDPLTTLRDYVSAHAIPPFVLLVQGDNELFLDLGNDGYLSLLLDELRKPGMVRLCEWPEPIRMGTYRWDYVRQVVLPMTIINRKKKDSDSYFPAKAPSGEYTEMGNVRKKVSVVQRSFAPGSEWAYFKIYLSADSADKALVRYIHPVLHSLEKEKVITQYFFIRYKDPHFHLRLRLKLREGSAAKDFGSVVWRIHFVMEKMRQNELLWKWEMSTYERELERYGYTHIEATEYAFYRDSIAVLKLLKMETKEDDVPPRILNGVHLVDTWLNLFSLGVQDKIHFCDLRVEAFLKEFGKDARYACEAEIREKNWILRVSHCIQGKPDMDRHYRLVNIPALKQSCLPDYIHMSLNRWYKDDQRLEEFRTFILVRKYYDSAINTKQK